MINETDEPVMPLEEVMQLLRDMEGFFGADHPWKHVWHSALHHLEARRQGDDLTMEVMHHLDGLRSQFVPDDDRIVHDQVRDVINRLYATLFQTQQA